MCAQTLKRQYRNVITGKICSLKMLAMERLSVVQPLLSDDGGGSQTYRIRIQIHTIPLPEQHTVRQRYGYAFILVRLFAYRKERMRSTTEAQRHPSCAL